MLGVDDVECENHERRQPACPPWPQNWQYVHRAVAFRRDGILCSVPWELCDEVPGERNLLDESPLDAIVDEEVEVRCASGTSCWQTMHLAALV